MKYLKFLNCIPLVLFCLLDMMQILSEHQIALVVIVVLCFINMGLSKDMKSYLISSALLLFSTVVGVIADTYYYFYNVSSDPETPIVGAFLAMVFGILVLIFIGIGAVFFHFKNK